MKNAIIVTALSFVTASGTLFAQPRFSVGVAVGGPAPQYYGQAQQSYEQAPDYAPEQDYASAQDYAYDAYNSGPQYDTQPPCPGPGYFWTSGSWYPSAGRRLWRTGFWAPPVYRGYSGPSRFYGQSYSRGYQPRGGYQGSYTNNFSGNSRNYVRDNNRDYNRNNNRDYNRNNNRNYGRDNFRGEHQR